jgi:hypothetical protein
MPTIRFARVVLIFSLREYKGNEALGKSFSANGLSSGPQRISKLWE